jgi:hypothetical protein
MHSFVCGECEYSTDEVGSFVDHTRNKHQEARNTQSRSLAYTKQHQPPSKERKGHGVPAQNNQTLPLDRKSLASSDNKLNGTKIASEAFNRSDLVRIPNRTSQTEVASKLSRKRNKADSSTEKPSKHARKSESRISYSDNTLLLLRNVLETSQIKTETDAAHDNERKSSVLSNRNNDSLNEVTRNDSCFSGDKHSLSQRVNVLKNAGTQAPAIKGTYTCEVGAVLPDGLDQLPPSNELFTVILTTV